MPSPGTTRDRVYPAAPRHEAPCGPLPSALSVVVTAAGERSQRETDEDSPGTSGAEGHTHLHWREIMTKLSIHPIAAFSDNYIWVLRDPPASRVAVVDPGDAEPVLAYLKAAKLDLTAILITHHHQDHIGGVAELLEAYPAAQVLAPHEPRIPQGTQRVGGGERVTLHGLGAVVDVLSVPGHTSTHVAYLTVDLAGRALFCGDTLFGAGCGRVFDGTVEQLAGSLRRIASLPADTRCYCAHEYTLANLGFAQWVEPDAAALTQRVVEAGRLRARGEPTLPSTLALERATNPFLRVDEPGVIAAAERAAGRQLNGPTEVFAALRQWKGEAYD